MYPWGLGLILLCPCLFWGDYPKGRPHLYYCIPITVYVLKWQFELLSFDIYEPCRYFTAGKIVETWISIDVNNKSCCDQCDFCQHLQAWSCTSVMCKAACRNSVLHACLAECCPLSMEKLSCLLVLCWNMMSLLVRITHNLLWCSVTRTKVMDSLFICVIDHLRLTLCYGLCNQ